MAIVDRKRQKFEMPGNELGLVCPRCGHNKFSAEEVEPAVRAIVRKRACRQCYHIIRTVEVESQAADSHL